MIHAMRARKIPIGMLTLTGYFYSFKNKGHVEYESLLERDFYLSLEFNDNVLSYKAQAVKVPKRIDGKTRTLYPDCLIAHTRQSGIRPLLVEVKHTKDINDPNKAEHIQLKISILKEFAEKKRWDFKLVTEQDVRGPRLENYRFLYKYTEPPSVFPKYGKIIRDWLIKSGPLSVTKLMEGIFIDKTERASALPCMWHLVRKGQLTTDLDVPLTNSSVLEVSNV